MEAAGRNGLAVASLVFSILFFGGLGSLIAIVLGWIAQERTFGGRERGEGLANAGVIIGWLGLIVGAALWFLIGVPVLGAAVVCLILLLVYAALVLAAWKVA